MRITFCPFSRFPRGTMLALLKDAYSFEPGYERDWLENWQEADRFFYDHLQIADQCGFVTVLNGNPIGLICWDPRNLPEYAEIGHNCIAAACKGNGYGKAQLQEAIRRIRKSECRKIIVTTDEQLLPAQKNYESVGFRFVQFRENNINPAYAGRIIDYEMIL